MKPVVLTNASLPNSTVKTKYLPYLVTFFCGLLGPLSFAPFHFPGLVFLSIAGFYYTLNCYSDKKAFLLGLFYGLGFFGLGVSWIIISIHDYGNLNYAIASLATLGFIFYLALFKALVSHCFKLLHQQNNIINGLLFSSLWCLSEYLRATLFTGFPWLLLGTAQMDTPLGNLFPVIGIYGVSFLSTFACALLSFAVQDQSIKRYWYVCAFVLVLIIPESLKNIQWTDTKPAPLSTAVIQANLAMRDKWDDSLFWSMLKHYEKNINALLGTNIIILPESAIPLPSSYLSEYLLSLHHRVREANSALLLGILQPTDETERYFYNSMISLGHAKGEHIKQHLVPFGEYLPKPIAAINQWLNLEAPNITPGKKIQPLIMVGKHPIASLICYEIAYPHLLRLQLPVAEWIISISDDGWFGHSLASYQQQQMAQVLSALTGRFQILANNDGLSSVIDTKGQITDSLPPFSSGILQSKVFSATGVTPWVWWGDSPVLLICTILPLLLLFLKLKAFRRK